MRLCAHSVMQNTGPCHAVSDLQKMFISLTNINVFVYYYSILARLPKRLFQNQLGPSILFTVVGVAEEHSTD